MRRPTEADVQGIRQACALRRNASSRTKKQPNKVEADPHIFADPGLLTIRDRDDATILDAVIADGASDAGSPVLPLLSFSRRQSHSNPA
jgi:hypothetical protein